MSKEQILNELQHYGDIDYLLTLSLEELIKIYKEIMGGSIVC